MWIREGDRDVRVDLERRWENSFQISGWMGDGELEGLYNLARDMDSIVEIGCWKGKSTYALACGCKGRVYAVDHFMGSKEHQKEIEESGKSGYPYDMFMENMRGFDNLVVLRMSSEQAAFSDLIPAEVDMVFLDGDHSFDGVMKDLRYWDPMAGKIICGHDFSDPEVVLAIGAYFKGSGREIMLKPNTNIWGSIRWK